MHRTPHQKKEKKEGSPRGKHQAKLAWLDSLSPSFPQILLSQPQDNLRSPQPQLTATMDSCAQCKKSPPEVSLKQCAKCNVTKYCSRDCQRANWKTHKKTCVKANTAYNTPPKAFDQPFARIS